MHIPGEGLPFDLRVLAWLYVALGVLLATQAALSFFATGIITIALSPPLVLMGHGLLQRSRFWWRFAYTASILLLFLFVPFFACSPWFGVSDAISHNGEPFRPWVTGGVFLSFLILGAMVWQFVVLRRSRAYYPSAA